MSPEELLRRLAVLIESGKVYFEFEGRDVYFELLPIYNELITYLPAPVITDEGLKQLELGEGGE